MSSGQKEGIGDGNSGKHIKKVCRPVGPPGKHPPYPVGTFVGMRLVPSSIRNFRIPAQIIDWLETRRRRETARASLLRQFVLGFSDTEFEADRVHSTFCDDAAAGPDISAKHEGLNAD